jgi:hydroxymethylpyrimidine pyrophosphatase-like HAD family hydrolase
MFFDETKETMISTEFKKGSDLNKFHEEQKDLVEEMKKILDFLGVNNLKIEPSIIATDIQNPHVGKDLGVERFLTMIHGKPEPEEFATFGDSPSDLEMYKYLTKKGHKAKFIYVGNKEIEDGENIIKTKAKFDLGTVEYLLGN